MLSTYVSLAARRMRRHTGYVVLNVVGLAIGLAGCLLIACFVGSELSVDRFHDDADRTFRVVQATDDGGSAWTGGAHAALLRESTAGVEATARVIPEERTLTIPEGPASEQAVFVETAFAYVDPSFFDVFSFQLATGDPETALDAPGTIVLSGETARRYFGDADPLGQVVTMYDAYNEPNQVPLTVTGVLADTPGRSHLDLNALSSTSTFEGQYGPLTQFGWPGLYTYARLASGADPQAIAASTTAAIPTDEEASPLGLQPLTDIFLHPQPEGEPGAMGSITMVYGLSAMALIVLLLACINFANLAVARASAQVRAAGIRRSVGAQRSQLMTESLVDTYVQIGVALVIALVIVAGSLPWVGQVVGQDLSSVISSGPPGVLLLVGLVVLTGLVAGGYPAVLVARQQPALSLRGMVRHPRGTTRLRSGLVVAQFGCAVALLVGALIVQSQVDYVRDLSLGFDRQQVVTLEGKGARRSFEPVRDALAAVPGVVGVTASQGVPGTQEVQMPEVARREGSETGGQPMYVQGVGPEFFETLGIRFVAGRAPVPSEEPESIPFETPDRLLVVNETAASGFGWTPEEALDRRIRILEPGNEDNNPGLTGTIVGVSADIHHGSARDPIPASAYHSAQSTDVPGMYVVSHMLVRLAPGTSTDVIDDLKAAWHRVLPDKPVEAAFLDDQVLAQYATDLRLSQTVGVFAVLAVFIACLGLFGLASLVAQQRTQEIGVRKSLGATSGQIAALFSGRFLRLVAVAFVVSVPIAYVLAQRWLDAFAYRIDLGPGLFLVAGLLVTLVSMAAIVVQVTRAARTSPVDALRYE
ncbi:MAG: ABC transporter permease [Bacteroidota bacterium]